MFTFFKSFFKNFLNSNKEFKKNSSKKAFTLLELLLALGLTGGTAAATIAAAAANPSMILPALGGLGAAATGGYAANKGIKALISKLSRKGATRQTLDNLKEMSPISTGLSAGITGAGTIYGLNKSLNKKTDNKSLNKKTDNKSTLNDLSSQFPTLFK